MAGPGAPPQQPAQPIAPPNQPQPPQAGRLPVSAGAIGNMMGDPDIDPATKAIAMELLAPKTYQSATGQVLPSFQKPATARPSIANLGVRWARLSAALLRPLSGVGRRRQSLRTRLRLPRCLALAQRLRKAASRAGRYVSLWPVSGRKNPEGLAETGAAVSGIKSAGDASTAQFATERQAATEYPRRTLPLQKAIPLLEKLGTQGSGPGKKNVLRIASFLQSNGVQISDPDKIKDYDELNKYLTDYVNQNGDRSTNDKFAAAFAGNPSVLFDTALSLDVAKTALGMMRFNQAAYQSAVNNHIAPNKYADYKNQFVSQVDPRAFGMDMMSPDALGELKREWGRSKRMLMATRRIQLG